MLNGKCYAAPAVCIVYVYGYNIIKNEENSKIISHFTILTNSFFI